MLDSASINPQMSHQSSPEKESGSISGLDSMQSMIWNSVNCGLYLVEVLQDGSRFRFLQGNPFFYNHRFIPTEVLSVITIAPGDEVSEVYFQHYQECYMNRSTLKVEEKIQRNGQDQWWHLNLDPIISSQGQITHLVGTLTEITDRKRSDVQAIEYADRQVWLNHLTNQIFSSLDRNSVIQEGIQAIFHFLDLDYSGFAWFDDQVEMPSWQLDQEVLTTGGMSGIGSYPATLLGNIEVSLQQGSVIQIDDVRDHGDPAHRAFLKSRGIRSRLLVPVITESGQVGMIVCDRHRLQPWREDEVDSVRAVADRLTTGLNHADYQTQLQTQAQASKHQLKDLQQRQIRVLQTEKMTALSQLVAGVAHELNNPVGFIYGNLDPAAGYAEDLMRIIALYQKYYPDPHPEIDEVVNQIDLLFVMADLPRLIESMRMGADRITQIVLSLRTFSRLDESDFKPVDIHDGIDSTLMVLENRLQESEHCAKIRVIKNYDDLPWVECYAGKLNQVFLNILNNAIDAIISRYQVTPDLLPQIVIQTREVSQDLEIRIQDNGSGIDQATIKQIFDPFFTTKPIGQGTGMGLAMSHQIITEDHQGRLTCVSRLGEGSEFILRIPMHQKQIVV
jgi:two-component system, NtrC family, sensor kinase